MKDQQSPNKKQLKKNLNKIKQDQEIIATSKKFDKKLKSTSQENPLKQKSKKIKKQNQQKSQSKSTNLNEGSKKFPENTLANKQPKQKKPLDKKQKKLLKKKQKEQQKNQNSKPKANSKPKVAFKPLIEDFKEFYNVETNKLLKIRKQTIKKIQLDKELIKKAVKSLMKYHLSQKNQKNLLDNNEDFIYLEIILSQIPENYSIRPIQIPLPVPLYKEEYNNKFCIICKDPQRALKDKIQNLDIPCIAKVIGFSKLPKKHPTFEDKRILCRDYDQFFCDYRIYDSLRKPLGKIFYDKKKIPFPMDTEQVPQHLQEKFGNNFQDYLNDLCNYTYFMMGNGPAYTLKIARVSMKIKEIVKNVIHAIYNTIPHLLKNNLKHTKVEQIQIKTFNSISLPIFNQIPKSYLKAYAEYKQQDSKKVEEEEEE